MTHVQHITRYRRALEVAIVLDVLVALYSPPEDRVLTVLCFIALEATRRVLTYREAALRA
ncbi:MAG: hypothetical protein H6725_12530 [Sandaracinaceae bacterium]|nr:hypothetical protein [Sandaracinaceae bacterium]